MVRVSGVVREQSTLRRSLGPTVTSRVVVATRVSTTAPVDEGEQYTVEIDEMGDEGDGIADVEDFVIVVPDASMGERVTVEIESVQDDFATAEVVESS